MLKIKNKWLWDFWLYQQDELWHIFYLQADKALGDPELRHWHVSHGHAISSDLFDWQVQGSVFAPAAQPSWDDCSVWTGSVVRSDSGQYHYFYTGTSHADSGLKQRIGHAVGDQLGQFTRVGTGQCLDLGADSRYEEYTPAKWHDRALRDPWVMRDPESEGWLMYFTARVPGIDEANAGGAIGLARSDNLYYWRLLDPIFSGGFGELEVPQVFSYQGKWYCLFCTMAHDWSRGHCATTGMTALTGTHYLVANHHLGPWRLAPGFLDGANPPQRYAGKIVQHQGQHYLLSFLHSDAESNFIGAIADPIKLALDNDGWWRLEQ